LADDNDTPSSLYRPIDHAIASLCNVSPECTSIYEVRLQQQFTSGR
jgi:hypothetical protein